MITLEDHTMTTFKGTILTMNGYKGQTGYVDGVLDNNTAKKRLEALYPGAKIVGIMTTTEKR